MAEEYGKTREADKEASAKVAHAHQLHREGHPLTAAARAHIKKSNFALPASESNTGKPAYPIHDRKHAAVALGFVAMHGSPEQKKAVRAAVHRKYPDMGGD